MAEPEAGPSGPKPDEVCKEVCKFNVPSKDWWLKEPRACPFTGLSIGNLGRVKPKLHDEFREAYDVQLRKDGEGCACKGVRHMPWAELYQHTDKLATHTDDDENQQGAVRPRPRPYTPALHTPGPLALHPRHHPRGPRPRPPLTRPRPPHPSPHTRTLAQVHAALRAHMAELDPLLLQRPERPPAPSDIGRAEKVSHPHQWHHHKTCCVFTHLDEAACVAGVLASHPQGGQLAQALASVHVEGTASRHVQVGGRDETCAHLLSQGLRQQGAARLRVKGKRARRPQLSSPPPSLPSAPLVPRVRVHAERDAGVAC